MSEQVFNFPNFYDREIDLTSRESSPTGIPAGVVGASLKGPAFIPFTVGSFADFQTKFGGLNSKIMAPYAVQAFLGNANALTFVKVLGAGANTTSADIEATRTGGFVKNAGFVVSGALTSPSGTVKFLLARHLVAANGAAGYPLFSDNSSYSATASHINLVRGVIFTANTANVLIMSGSAAFSDSATDDMATYTTPAGASEPFFKIAISSSLGSTFGTADGNTGVRILSASFNPSSDIYIGKVLNTDPTKFATEQHYLYTDFAVDAEVATVDTTANGVIIASGSSTVSSVGGDTTSPMLNLFGRYDTRYTNPKTPIFISQPFGGTEYDLFHFESIDDGAYGNTQVKISIQNLAASTNAQFPYGTFAVVIRTFSDNDLNPEVLEQFTDLSLNPDDEKYIAKVIGDATAKYFFDAESEEDRRIVKQGNYPNRSKYVRVVMNTQVDQKKIPATCLPFGHHGFDVLNTSPSLTDSGSVGALIRLAAKGTVVSGGLQAIVPPVPFRYKVTRGTGAQEISDSRFYWGVKFERNNNDVLNVNINGEPNKFISNIAKFQGIEKLDVLVTGSAKDTINNNKFTLARVAISGSTTIAGITGTADKNMKRAIYIRNGSVNSSTYTVSNHVTLATLLQTEAVPTTFNKFAKYAKFTTMLQGGFDGVNILDEHAVRFDDKSTSTETGGGASSAFTSPGFAINQNGASLLNNQINSYKVATNIITDPIASNINVLAVPGQREPMVTDYVAAAASTYGLALYAMDIPNYNSAGDRIFDNAAATSASYIDVSKTADTFDSRGLNNTFVASYFPDIVITDTTAGKKVTVPASVATLAAISYNDKVAYPWFAPAGFNRAALNFVSQARTRVNQTEREKLYKVRINPIVKFPNEGYVIFAQKTLDAAHTALENINVQRMIMSLQRKVIDIGNRMIWEQITPDLYKDFVAKVSPELAAVQTKGGLNGYKIVCDDTNNTDLDRENNRMNAKIFVLPVKAVEFVAIDFIITRAGVVMGS